MNLKTVAEANSGQIHGLVNSVVYFGSKGITVEKEDWDKSFSVNVVGYANMVQACYEYTRKMPGDKSIVHTASISGHRCQPTRYKNNITTSHKWMVTYAMQLLSRVDKG